MILGAGAEAGVQANLSMAKGDTLLMPTAYHAHAETVRKPVTSGADGGQASDRGWRPLAGVLFKEKSAVVRALSDTGAEPAAAAPSAWDQGANVRE